VGSWQQVNTAAVPSSRENLCTSVRYILIALRYHIVQVRRRIAQFALRHLVNATVNDQRDALSTCLGVMIDRSYTTVSFVLPASSTTSAVV